MAKFCAEAFATFDLQNVGGALSAKPKAQASGVVSNVLINPGEVAIHKEKKVAKITHGYLGYFYMSLF